MTRASEARSRGLCVVAMERGELQADRKSLLNFPKLPVWIIEYVWAHKMMDIQEVVDPCNWPDVDSQPLSIQDSWRLRVASAQVYSIMKSRDMELFERVMNFLETTYRLLPTLVTPIKHMKIMFGLKTMVIMWMLREGRGMVDTLFKISQFFPSKLPQYQDQSNQHEMFLMRKNNQDFKALAQSLAMDKDKLEDYIKKGMETQYGKHYAQKVEDRLLHYLHELESVLPGDTFIDKILKKESPVTEEEKLLLEVITSDSATIATTLRKLLHCDVTSCRAEHGEDEMKTSQLSKSPSPGSSTKVLLKLGGDETVQEFQPVVCEGGEGAVPELSKDSPALSESDNHLDVRTHQQTEEGGEVIIRMEEESSDKDRPEASERARDSPSHFCSKHQRWVKSILQECPVECSQDVLLMSSSPLLFLSSSSTSSSQDRTPSDLIPSPPDQQHPASETTPPALIAAHISDQANPKDEQISRSACDASLMTALPQASSRDTPLPPKDPPNTAAKSQTSPVPHDAATLSISNSHQTETLPSFSRLSRKRRWACPTSSQNLVTEEFEKAQTTLVCAVNKIPTPTKLAPQVVTRSSVRLRQSKVLQCSNVASSTSNSDHVAVRSEPSRAQLRLSLPCQAVLLQSTLLQPCVRLTRLSAQECYQMTEGRFSARHVEPVSEGSSEQRRKRKKKDEDSDSSVDVYTLDSNYYSSSDSEDSINCDPDYKPYIRKKRLLLEYENARSLI